MSKIEIVVVLGASDKPDRYSNKAIQLLLDYHHTVIPVHPSLESINGIPVVHHLLEIKIPVDTITVYVNPEITRTLTTEILSLKPKRVIFNPQTECDDVEEILTKHKIIVVRACTLVLLRSNKF